MAGSIANYAFMFERSGNIWDMVKRLNASDHVNTAGFGEAVAVSGDNAIVGSYSDWRDTSGVLLSDAGSVYYFERTAGTDVAETDRNPGGYRLEQNYPNPFNPSTTVSFVIGNSSFVSLKVFDILGREVAILLDGRMEAGEHSVRWDAASYPSGVYYYRMTAGKYSETEKMVLVR